MSDDSYHLIDEGISPVNELGKPGTDCNIMPLLN